MGPAPRLLQIIELAKETQCIPHEHQTWKYFEMPAKVQIFRSFPRASHLADASQKRGKQLGWLAIFGTIIETIL